MISEEISTNLGYTINATVYKASPGDKVLIIASATGVKQGFYKKFADFISSNGITVITFDYAGIGKSLKQPIKKVPVSVKDWGMNDLEAVIRFTRKTYPTAQLSLLGHSIGGQLVGLAQSSYELNQLILVAAQSGYWKWWKGTDRMKMWLNWHILFPVLINTFGYMPSKKISGMENLPKHVARQWSSWGRKANYLFDEIPADALHYHKITATILAISIEKDFYAPQKAVDWLSGKYLNAPVKKLHLTAEEYHSNEIGHFGIFRENFAESIWKMILNELEGLVSQPIDNNNT
ncbi:alpha/beta hydrolase [Flavihumibacter rivuli]|uniref:alpha/beta hydrolase family protein n=1 Tax=Flavihumibacter rivuli TaxID=2838156 RepID=UPI001BDF2FE6|nr:alpha/beta fold hydrolase [Flavihumibacter rivuli]ULQ57878.1 alpha/beta hydrolase [Flavihumibacter rivuli]